MQTCPVVHVDMSCSPYSLAVKFDEKLCLPCLTQIGWVLVGYARDRAVWEGMGCAWVYGLELSETTLRGAVDGGLALAADGKSSQGGHTRGSTRVTDFRFRATGSPTVVQLLQQHTYSSLRTVSGCMGQEHQINFHENFWAHLGNG